jgi:hypothetical protein
MLPHRDDESGRNPALTWTPDLGLFLRKPGLQIFSIPLLDVADSIIRRDQGVTVRFALTVTLLLAEIVTDRVEVTAAVVIANVAVVAPAATVKLAGTWAVAVRLLVSVTTIPPAGAGPSSVTVPVDGFPPLTLLGLRIMEEALGAVTVKVTICVVPPKAADILGVWLEATGLVVAVNVAVVAPAATVTDDGTWAAAVLLDVSVTTAPPVGAGPLSVTVPVDDTPPSTEAGLTLTDVSAAADAVTVKVAVRLILL